MHDVVVLAAVRVSLLKHIANRSHRALKEWHYGLHFRRMGLYPLNHKIADY